MDSMDMFSLFYLLFSFCIVFPNNFFVSCGLTVEFVFARWLGTERESFVRYHLRRITFTYMVHSSLPLGYVLLRMYLDRDFHVLGSAFWQSVLVGSVTLVFVTGLKMNSWIKNGWALHPVCVKLSAFGDSHLQDLIRAVDNDFNSPNKMEMECDLVSKVVGTPDWLLKTSHYSLDFAHQSDAFLQVLSALDHNIAMDDQGGAQFLQIRVTSPRPNTTPFFIRINSRSLKDLQNMLVRPIRIMDHVRVQSTLADRFLVAFKEQVQLNPVFPVTAPIDDDCWGCGEKRPNVMLVKTCGDWEGRSTCSVCSCRPTWCVDCMGTWFASRQDQDAPGTWMSAKCTCPLCRSTFCVLDVCYLRYDANADDN